MDMNTQTEVVLTELLCKDTHVHASQLWCNKVSNVYLEKNS
jgi:hypothetical protein